MSDETDWIAPGYRQSAFQNGHITWIPLKGARTHAGDDGKLSYALASVAAHAAKLLDMKRDDAKARILRQEPTGGGQWCGFTLANLYKAAGMDPQFTFEFESTESLTEFGSYYRQDILRNAILPQWIVRTEGRELREWHAANNASRRVVWWDELQGSATPDIMPGDIVLLDHKEGAGADHIQVVLDWYPADRLVTVDTIASGDRGRASKFVIIEAGKPAPTMPASIKEELRYINSQIEIVSNVKPSGDVVSKGHREL